jgi:hypothetical protein
MTARIRRSSSGTAGTGSVRAEFAEATCRGLEGPAGKGTARRLAPCCPVVGGRVGRRLAVRVTIPRWLTSLPAARALAWTRTTRSARGPPGHSARDPAHRNHAWSRPAPGHAARPRGSGRGLSRGPGRAWRARRRLRARPTRPTARRQARQRYPDHQRVRHLASRCPECLTSVARVEEWAAGGAPESGRGSGSGCRTARRKPQGCPCCPGSVAASTGQSRPVSCSSGAVGPAGRCVRSSAAPSVRSRRAGRGGAWG